MPNYQTNDLEYGQKLIRLKGTWEEVAYVVDKEPSHLVRLSPNWPFNPEEHHSFFLNLDKINRVYRKAEIGEQLMIPGTEKADPLKRLRDKHITK